MTVVAASMMMRAANMDSRTLTSTEAGCLDTVVVCIILTMKIEEYFRRNRLRGSYRSLHPWKDCEML